jgi:hypothetical protein
MFEQEAKQLIDVGEIGNASTGDILFDDGNKINNNFNGIYNAFGDQRKMALDNGQGSGVGQVIHATGYWQKSNDPLEFTTPVPNGSQYDIDTSGGAVQVTLSKGVRGEAVFFCNSNGSFSPTNPLTIDANDTFATVTGSLRITSPYVFVKCWCISDEGGRSVWDYSVESMFGEKHIPTDGTWQLGAVGTSVDIPLFHNTEFTVAKYLITAETSNGSKAKSCEINIHIDRIKKEVNSVEYAVIRIGAVDTPATSTTPEVIDKIFVPSFAINPSTGYVVLTLTPGVAGLRAAVKAIATQKIGNPR